jgi:hypothetical protein
MPREPAERPAAPAALAAPVETPPAPAVAPLRVRPFILPQRRLAIVAICHVDVGRFCADMPPGGGRILECLAANASSLGPDCYAAVARVSIR